MLIGLVCTVSVTFSNQLFEIREASRCWYDCVVLWLHGLFVLGLPRLKTEVPRYGLKIGFLVSYRAVSFLVLSEGCWIPHSRPPNLHGMVDLHLSITQEYETMTTSGAWSVFKWLFAQVGRASYEMTASAQLPVINPMTVCIPSIERIY